MLQTKKEIENWLEEMGVSLDDVRIHDDLTVDVRTNLNLDRKGLTEIPVQFGIISGNLNVHHNALTSLSFVKEVNFSVMAMNNQINTLEDFPIVHGAVMLAHNKINSLKGLPKEIKGSLNINHNELTSLEYCSEIVDGSFNCSYNPLLSLNYLPKKIEWEMNCYGMKFEVLNENFENVEMIAIVLEKAQDKDKELGEFYEKEKAKDRIFLPLEELKKYQLKKSLEKNLTEQLEVNKPKI